MHAPSTAVALRDPLVFTCAQVATTHWLEGPACFGRIACELEALMARKGYADVASFRGKLKPYAKEHAKRADAPAPAAGGARAAGGGAWAQWALAVALPLLAVLLQREVARQMA